MYQQAVMDDLVRHIVLVAESEGASSVTHVDVELGRLSDLTPEHFREQYVSATRGTIAEGAAVDATISDERGADVVLLGLELEVP